MLEFDAMDILIENARSVNYFMDYTSGEEVERVHVVTRDGVSRRFHHRTGDTERGRITVKTNDGCHVCARWSVEEGA